MLLARSTSRAYARRTRSHNRCFCDAPVPCWSDVTPAWCDGAGPQAGGRSTCSQQGVPADPGGTAQRRSHGSGVGRGPAGSCHGDGSNPGVVSSGSSSGSGSGVDGSSSQRGPCGGAGRAAVTRPAAVRPSPPSWGLEGCQTAPSCCTAMRCCCVAVLLRVGRPAHTCISLSYVVDKGSAVLPEVCTSASAWSRPTIGLLPAGGLHFVHLWSCV